MEEIVISAARLGEEGEEKGIDEREIKKKNRGTVSEQIASRRCYAVRQHVTVTRAFQLIKNKRCQRSEPVAG